MHPYRCAAAIEAEEMATRRVQGVADVDFVVTLSSCAGGLVAVAGTLAADGMDFAIHVGIGAVMIVAGLHMRRE
jgi:hypothetical protein